ncbi:hypothetical protein AK830_g9632 [Neonectria ditissima]|uniref:Rhodopsin domain-containing protein n=1 Tax=Neonectria ditissima TaxID=78410 RepID=A0A0P7B8Z0_9HYPO|nr:hypothetical protein AK830_g9632 [Neonectria ditissima]
MSTGGSPDAAALAAAEAFRKFTIESWTLYSIGLASTLLRTYARLRAAGLRGLRAEDYLMWIGVVRLPKSLNHPPLVANAGMSQMFYTVQANLAYSIGNVAQGLANNGMTDDQRLALSPSDREYELRVIGSKIQVAGWTTYSALIWSLKLSMLFFYTRLTDGLGRPYRIRIHIGFVLVIATFIATILAIFLGCRPFNKYWQISPDPGNSCQAAVSKPVVWVSFAANVSTDIYLIAIPVPMLWQSTLKTIKKIASTIVLGAGIFVLVCATLKSVFVLVDPVNGAQLAGSWGTREAFVAVITTNLPILFPLFRTWLTPMFGTMMRSSQKTYNTPSGFRTIGGGGGEQSRSRRGPPTANPITANMSFNGSEERMVDDVKMQNFKVSSRPVSDHQAPAAGIVVSNQVEVTREDRSSQNSDHLQRAREW